MFLNLIFKIVLVELVFIVEFVILIRLSVTRIVFPW